LSSREVRKSEGNAGATERKKEKWKERTSEWREEVKKEGKKGNKIKESK